MRKLYLAPIFALNLLASGVYADHARGFYAGGIGSFINCDTLVNLEANRDAIDLPAVEINVGYKYNNWLGVELRYGLGLDERELYVAASGSDPAGTGQYNLDSFHSVYLRSEITNNEAKLYFLLGNTSIDATEELVVDGVPQGAVKSSASGLSYGIGAGWFVDDHLNVNLEYRSLIDKADTTYSAASLSVDYRFSGTSLKFW